MPGIPWRWPCENISCAFPYSLQAKTLTWRSATLIISCYKRPYLTTWELHKTSNFLFLTGANMAGKSTFIRAVGEPVFLAHVVMGVPAGEMRLNLFDGILSNINVVDNIAKGESY